MISTTPMMSQYLAIKAQHADGLLFYRMGDFFELFWADAEEASRLLGLTLTSREKGEGKVPMAGVPVRSVDNYVARLLRLGRKVVLCDQVQDPKEAKGLVERAVVRIITPGTVTEDSALDAKENNFLLGAAPRGDVVGLAWVDLSTGEFKVEDVAAADWLDAVRRVDPAECLIAEAELASGGRAVHLRGAVRGPVTPVPDAGFERAPAENTLLTHFRVRTLSGFGIDPAAPCVGAAGAVLRYLLDTQKGAAGHITGLQRVRRGDTLVVDATAAAALELVRNARDGGRTGTLFAVLDRTATSMGARLLRSWILAPECRTAEIRRRQNAVGELCGEPALRDRLLGRLRGIQDIERLASRVGCGRANARDLIALGRSLEVLPDVRADLATAWSEPLIEAGETLPDLSELAGALCRAFVDDPPAAVREGGMIRRGFNSDLDGLTALGAEGKTFIAGLEAREAGRTGIPTLKVGFNSVFGYYIEITHAHAAKVPPEYVRKQTLRNAERYITPELKEHEDHVLHAEERSRDLEYRIFVELRDRAAADLPRIRLAAGILARLDVLLSLAQVAREEKYVRPEVDDGTAIEIRDGRHPVLQKVLPSGGFVPNDLALDSAGDRLFVITGPNMAGKSTFIRQAALQVIMAQMGGFVPATSARVGIVDRIFTRIGASDDLARGSSTFMVEMTETAEILRSATGQSLVILDEVGRGTSTEDGLAIAWAVTEHLAKEVGARTLFATHYHELADIARSTAGVRNLNVLVREWGDEIIFLHKIVEGSTDRSYGIHVARLAGLPEPVWRRAGEILGRLAARDVPAALGATAEAPGPGRERQLSLFDEVEDPLRTAVLALDPDRLTPIDALLRLRELRSLAEQRGA